MKVHLVPSLYKKTDLQWIQTVEQQWFEHSVTIRLDEAIFDIYYLLEIAHHCTPAFV